MTENSPATPPTRPPKNKNKSKATGSSEPKTRGRHAAGPAALMLTLPPIVAAALHEALPPRTRNALDAQCVSRINELANHFVLAAAAEIDEALSRAS